MPTQGEPLFSEASIICNCVPRARSRRRSGKPNGCCHLYFEGHAKSYGEQGGNHRFVLDIEHNTVWFYPKAKWLCHSR